MARHSSRPHSYREDPAVPGFDDTRPLFVFDGHCALCSTGVRWLMAADQVGRVRFTSGQGPLGSALYRHYGLELDTTFLLIDGGHCGGMSAGVLRLLPVIGGPWRLLEVMRILPEAWRDALYRVIARNRYRWFGRREHCVLLTAEQRERLI
jgi:predicted DCC family thiol-disulfide oxidoreductase YuxK